MVLGWVVPPFVERPPRPAWSPAHHSPLVPPLSISHAVLFSAYAVCWHLGASLTRRDCPPRASQFRETVKDLLMSSLLTGNPAIQSHRLLCGPPCPLPSSPVIAPGLRTKHFGGSLCAPEPVEIIQIPNLSPLTLPLCSSAETTAKARAPMSPPPLSPEWPGS